MSILESCLPLWLLETMDPTPEKWQLGIQTSHSFALKTQMII